MMISISFLLLEKSTWRDQTWRPLTWKFGKRFVLFINSPPPSSSPTSLPWFSECVRVSLSSTVSLHCDSSAISVPCWNGDDSGAARWHSDRRPHPLLSILFPFRSVPVCVCLCVFLFLFLFLLSPSPNRNRAEFFNRIFDWIVQLELGQFETAETFGMRSDTPSVVESEPAEPIRFNSAIFNSIQSDISIQFNQTSEKWTMELPVSMPPQRLFEAAIREMNQSNSPGFMPQVNRNGKLNHI